MRERIDEIKDKQKRPRGPWNEADKPLFREVVNRPEEEEW